MKNFFLTVSQDQNKEVSLAGILIQSFYIVCIPLVFIAGNNYYWQLWTAIIYLIIVLLLTDSANEYYYLLY